MTMHFWSAPVFIKTAYQAVTNHKALHGTEINPDNRTLPDRFILLKKIGNAYSKVTDFGDFVETPKIQGLLHCYTIAPVHVGHYVALLRDFIDISERWLNATNGEF
jgi:hypothetical protein